jgi:high-affinity iron transporter
MRAFSYLLLVSLAFSAACYSEAPTELPADLQLGVPLVRPDLKRAASLFQENCEPCHGKTGKGDGWRVKDLSGPRPRNFHEPAQVLRMSPTQAFKSVSEGVERTSMTAFDLLSNTDRWNLAFYVMSLGYTKEDAAKGEESLRSVEYLLTTTAALADVTNKDVMDHYIGYQKTEEAARQGLAYLRLDAPFRGTDAPLAEMRRGIADAIGAYRRGEHTNAKSILAAVHLDALDSQLKVLRLRDSGLALATDLEMRNLRLLFADSVPVRDIEAGAQNLATHLDSADELLAEEVSSGATITHTASIAFSYGIDGAWFLFLLLVLGTRRGSDRRERKVVGLGLIVGLVTAVAAWLGWSSVATVFPGNLRAYLTLGMSGLVAVASLPLLLLTVRHFRQPPQKRMVVPVSWLAFLFLLSAGVVIRDALEIVPAVSIVAATRPAAILGFVGAGVAMIILVGLLVQTLPRMGVNSRTGLLTILISSVAVMAAGSAARAAQNLNLLDSSIAGHLQSPWMSMWPTGESVVIQLFVATTCLLVLTGATLLVESTYD